MITVETNTQKLLEKYGHIVGEDGRALQKAWDSARDYSRRYFIRLTLLGLEAMRQEEVGA